MSPSNSPGMYGFNYLGIATIQTHRTASCSPWVVDSACNINLRRPIDGCNTGGVNGKQVSARINISGYYVGFDFLH